jgi:hypothetical protein
VIIDDKGTVATAYHCVASGLRPRVQTRSGEHYIGKSVAWKHSDDLALISVPELAGRPFLELRSEPVAQGARVYGLGHPFAPAADRKPSLNGLLQWSVSAGIVSAVSERLIQTDTALNPGNSGGPVVDTQGRIVGITSHKLAGDNVAFLSSHQALSELIASPEKRALGGQWGLALGSIGGLVDHPRTNVEVMAHAALREHLVATVGIGIPLAARSYAMERGSSWAVTHELSLALRQRMGRGSWSTAVELGGALTGLRHWTASYSEDTHLVQVLQHDSWAPGAFVRLGSGGAWMKVEALWEGPEPTWLVGVDVDWPGILGTF